MPYDPELCAEQTLDMRGWLEAAKQRHAALGLMIDETAATSGGWNVAMYRASYEGQAEIIAMWESALGEQGRSVRDDRAQVAAATAGAIHQAQVADREAAIAACPEPFWHDTHRYCPCCPWTDSSPQKYDRYAEGPR